MVLSFGLIITKRLTHNYKCGKYGVDKCGKYGVDK